MFQSALSQCSSLSQDICFLEPMRIHGGYWYKLKRRFYSLLIPYVIFNTLGYIKHILFGGGTPDILGYFVSMIESSTMPLWFVRELMIFALIAPVLYLLIQNKKLFGVTCIAITILVFVGAAEYRTFIYWLPIYCAGGYFAQYGLLDKEPSGNYVFKKIYMCICTAVLLISAWFLPNVAADLTVEQNVIFYVFRIACVGVILFWTAHLSLITLPESTDCSFFIYCTHFPVITLLQLILGKCFADDFKLQIYLITVIGAILIPMATAWILKRNMKGLWRVLNGGR